jgi:sulfur relay (sulfurtransferase) DsrF/TusC family protein
MGLPSLALLLRGGAYAHRSARADVDFALAAAALDFSLEVYFLGDAITQLAVGRKPDAARLPPGYRAWASLPELGQARLFAERTWLDRCEQRGIRPLAGLEGLERDELRARWRRCSHALVL